MNTNKSLKLGAVLFIVAAVISFIGSILKINQYQEASATLIWVALISLAVSVGAILYGILKRTTA